MRKSLLIFIFFLLGAQPSFADDDLRYFSGYEIEKKVNDKLKIFLNPEARFDDDISRLFYYHVRLGLTYKLAKYFQAGLTYRFANDKKSRTNGTTYWNHENRLELDLAPSCVIGQDWKLTDRVRFEYRNFEIGRIQWRLRNLVKISFGEFSIADFNFSPYVSNETYHPMNSGKFNKDWLTFGLVKKWTDNFSTDIYYRIETKRVSSKDEWDTAHIIGTKCKFSF